MRIRTSIAALCLTALASLANGAEPAPTNAIAHRFLAVDDGLLSLHHVDQTNPARNWTVKFGSYCMDLQLIGQDRVLLAVGDGYKEFALADGKELKAFGGLGGKTHSVERLPDGRTVLGGREFKGLPHGIVILDANDMELARFALPEHAWIRHLRTTVRGTLIVAAAGRISECTLDGKVLWTARVPGSNFKAVELAEGKVLVSCGPGGRTLREVERSGDVRIVLDGQALPEGSFCGFQRLANGDVMVANWLGHGAQHDGMVFFQYDAAGNVVWRFGRKGSSFVEVIVLDGLDTTQLHAQWTNGVVAPPAASKTLEVNKP